MLTVIVPVHNAERHLAKCLDSILAQTHRDLDVICVDDGSTDDSGLIAYSYAKCDARVTVVHKRNGGVCSARNVGLALARGEWLTFVDDDDWIDPEMYAAMLAHSDGCDLVSCGVRLHEQGRVFDFGANGSASAVSASDYLTLTLRHEAADVVTTNAIWNKLYRRDVIAGHGLRLDEDVTRGEDLSFNVRVLRNSQRVRLLPSPFYHYVRHEASVTRQPVTLDSVSHVTSMRRVMRLVADNPAWLGLARQYTADIMLSYILANAQDPIERDTFRASHPDIFWRLQREVDDCPGFLGYLNATERAVYLRLKDLYQQQLKESESPCG